MEYLESIILGIVQGITEFLPISSSGHLVIFEHIFGLHSKGIAFEVFVHFGTLLSVLAIYYHDVWMIIKNFFIGITHKNITDTYKNDSYFRLSIFLIIATIPSVLIGITIKSVIESIFHNLTIVGVNLVITGFVLFLTKFIKNGEKSVSSVKALLIGCAQMFAILPGISRSGLTISVGIFNGIPKSEAARFSFLLSVPAIFGAALLELTNIIEQNNTGINLLTLFIGLVVSFIVGFIAIRFLLNVIQKGKFSWFSPYCFFAGLIILIFT
jgi:undecaprenyl-diphosphatase